jgi:hypothetical protein
MHIFEEEINTKFLDVLISVNRNTPSPASWRALPLAGGEILCIKV